MGWSLKDASLLGVYDNLLLMTKHLYEGGFVLLPENKLYFRSEIIENLINKGALLYQIPSDGNAVYIYNPDHVDAHEGNYDFMKHFTRNEKINKLLGLS